MRQLVPSPRRAAALGVLALVLAASALFARDAGTVRAQTPGNPPMVFEGLATLNGQALPAGNTLEVWGLTQQTFAGQPYWVGVLCEDVTQPSPWQFAGTGSGRGTTFTPITPSNPVPGETQVNYANFVAGSISGTGLPADSQTCGGKRIDITINGFVGATNVSATPGALNVANVDTTGQRDTQSIYCRTNQVGSGTPGTEKACAPIERLLWNNDSGARRLILSLFGNTNPSFNDELVFSLKYHLDRDDLGAWINIARALGGPALQVAAVRWYDPTSGQPNEYVEMKNFGVVPWNPDGLVMTVGSSGAKFTFSGNGAVAAGASCKIYTGSAQQSNPDACKGSWDRAAGPTGYIADTHDSLSFFYTPLGVSGEYFAW